MTVTVAVVEPVAALRDALVRRLAADPAITVVSAVACDDDPAFVAGEVVLRHIGDDLVAMVLAAAAVARAHPDAVVMTPREREVIAAIGDGLSNKEIAHRLGIAAETVKSHVRNVMAKLTLHTRLQIAAYARQRPSR